LCFGRAADDRGQICPPLTALLELHSEIGGASGFIAPSGDDAVRSPPDAFRLSCRWRSIMAARNEDV